jgi:hypothetical protein
MSILCFCIRFKNIRTNPGKSSDKPKKTDSGIKILNFKPYILSLTTCFYSKYSCTDLTSIGCFLRVAIAIAIDSAPAVVVVYGR